MLPGENLHSDGITQLIEPVDDTVEREKLFMASVSVIWGLFFVHWFSCAFVWQEVLKNVLG